MGQKIGILGGGQLAQMLAQEITRLGHEPHIYSASAQDPAAQVTSFWHKGHLKNKTALKKFLRSVDHLTFESEWVDLEILKAALSSLPQRQKPKIAPSLSVLARLQDRFSQKKEFQKHKLPTMDFQKLNHYQDAVAFFQTAGPFVIKVCHGGYDGYGTYFIREAADLKKYKKLWNTKSAQYIGEVFCPFKKELAFCVARNRKNQIVFTPLVQTYQESGRCLWVKGPMKHKQLKSLQKKITKYLQTINYVGLITFEVFDHKNKLYINEIAPRVHNSGHYSLNALSDNQFSLHIKSLLNEKLVPLQGLTKGWAMYNLLGTGTKKDVAQVKNKISWKTSFWFYWYNKKDNRKGRKMGHINVCANTPDQALQRAQKAASMLNKETKGYTKS